MKIYKYFLLCGLAIVAASCAEDIEPSIPQHNPQEPIFKADNVEVVKDGALASDAVLNLESYKASSGAIPVMKLVKADSLPDGASVSVKVEISDTEKFERSRVLNTIPGQPAENGDVIYYAYADEWNDAQVFLMGKSPKVKTMYYRVPVYIDLDGSDYRLNSVDYYAAAGTIQETCFDMGFVIEDHYYLLSNGTTWDLGNADEVNKYAFTHSEYDVYDDPVFEIRFKVSQEVLDANGGGDYWKIAPASAVGTDNWGAMIGTLTDGDEALSGHLVSENAQSGKLTKAGSYKMIVNMEAMTYEITYLAQPDFLYTPGNESDWKFDTCAYMQLNSDNGIYYGVFPVSGNGFKITADPNWDDKSTTYGAASEDPADSGSFVAGDAGKNILPLTMGLNWINANYDPVGYQLTTYEITAINTVGVIGSFAASSWGSDVDMTSADEGKTWTADIEFKAGDKYKFRFNGIWDYNLGGDTHQLTLNGADIEATEDGTYTVTLNLGSHYPSCTLTKK